MTPWLVTRAADEAAILVERMRTLGLQAEAMPCIERRAVDWALVPEARAGETILWMVSSPYGARRLIDAWPRIPGNARVASLAPTTARLLEQAGIAVEITAMGGAEGLAAAILRDPRTQGGRIVWLTSAAGLTEPEQQQAARRLESAAKLERIIAYETRSPPDLGKQLAAWRGRPASVVFFSPSACQNFLQANADAGAGPELRQVACIGRSTLRAWSDLRPAGSPAGIHRSNEDEFLRETAPTG